MQRRELEQLEVADRAVGDVEVGVEAQLAEARAGARDARAAARRAAPGRSRARVSSGPNSILARARPTRRRARVARLLGERRRRLQRARVAARRVGEHEARSRARVIATWSSRRISSTWASRVSGGSVSWSSASGIGSIARRRAPGIRDDCSPRTKTCSNDSPCEACIAITATAPARTPKRSAAAGGAVALRAGPALLVAQPGLGDRRDRAGELARRRLRRAAHVRGRELAEARERDEPLDDVGLGGEELAAAQPEAVDEPVDEDVGPRRVEGARRPSGGA